MQPEILTAAGDYFNLVNPRQSNIDITTIAHALSHLCRFTGHTRTFYSVAQHSVMVSYLVPPEDALAGLLHDATEAYVGDVAAPLKQMLTDYQTIERGVEKAVFTHFGLPTSLPASVKYADRVALAIEARDLMPAIDHVWDIVRGIDISTMPTIEPWAPHKAKRVFLERYNSLVLLQAFGDIAA
jgi:hypothetical protein